MALKKTSVRLPKVKAPKGLGKGTRSEKPLHASARALFGKDGDEVGLRIGFSPLAAVVDVSEKLATAVAQMDLLTQVARAWPNGRLARLRMAGARRELDAALDAVTDAELDEAGRRLRAIVGRAEATGSNRRLLEAARAEAEIRFPRGRGRVVTGAVPRSTAFDLVQRAARASDEIGMAQHSFDQALTVGDAATIREAGSALADTIAKHGKAAGMNAADRRKTRSAIATVVRSFELQVPTTSADAVSKAMFAAMEALPDASPIAGALRRVLPWLSVDNWPVVAGSLARIPPINPHLRMQAGDALDDAARWRVGVIKGILGDLIARNSRYRKIRHSEIARAYRFISGPGGTGWSELVSRTPIRATVADKTRFALSYDDAVLIMNAERKAVAVVMSAQFKAGDASSLKALAQTSNDVVRESGGKLLVDGQQYTVELGVVPTKRVFVGTNLGIDPRDPLTLIQQLETKELVFVNHPSNPADLDSVASFMLRAADIIPAD
jgi:hypothetical protein